MTSRHPDSAADPGFPRYFKIARRWVNSCKVFLCVGIYLGVLTPAAVAQRLCLPPLRIGFAALAVAILGLRGARIYRLLVSLPSI